MLLLGGKVSEQFASKKDTKVNLCKLTSHLAPFYTFPFQAMDRQRCVSTMESSMEISMEGSMIMKMSTSESEQSISDKCASRLSGDRSSFFSENQISDQEDILGGGGEDNGSINHCHRPLSSREGDYSDLQSHDSLGSIEEFLADSENHNVSFEKSNYFSLTFTNEDIENLTKANGNNGEEEEAFEAGAFLNSTVNVGQLEESDQEEDCTLVCNDIGLKKNSLKLFSPEKVLNAMTLMRVADSCNVEEKVSPMDLSSPDSNKSFTEDTMTQTLGSMSEESPPCIPVIEVRRGEDSLDEISSGEMSSGSTGNLSRISHNVSEFWDEVQLKKSEL